MTKRLIDASELQKLVKEFRNEAPCATARKHVCDVILSILGDETQTPTVDAVEVVRCMDCKHCRINEFAEISGMGFCRLTESGVRQDDFCSYGERRCEDG